MVEIPNFEFHELPSLYRSPNYWERRTNNKKENLCGFLISVNDLQRLVHGNGLNLTTLTIRCYAKCINHESFRCVSIQVNPPSSQCFPKHLFSKFLWSTFQKKWAG